jgi:hypothetical protein
VVDLKVTLWRSSPSLWRTVAAAQRILALEDDLAAERALTARLRAQQPGARDR